MDFIVYNIPGFIFGAIASAVASFFVWRNNKPLMDKLYAKAKSEFDPVEKELRGEIEKLKAQLQESELLRKMAALIEQKVSEAINKIKG